MFVEYLFFFSSFLICILTNSVIFVNYSLGFLFRDNSLPNQLLAVHVEDVGVLLDDGVHDGLREHGLVDLVVTKSSVANQINDHVSMPCGSPFSGNVSNKHHGFGIIGIDVENWSIDNSSN